MSGWFDGIKIDEVAFCEAFTEECPLIFVDGVFYTKDGTISEQQLEKQITDKLIAERVKHGISKKASSLLDLLKASCYCERFDSAADEINVLNGVLRPDGSFTAERNFCRNRLNVCYNLNAPSPVRWLKFLDELLELPDILTLQEYMGCCLISSTKAQAMLFIIGNGGEGKSRIGTVMYQIFGNSAYFGSINEIAEDKFLKYNLIGKSVLIDDDMNLEGLKNTSFLKSLATAETPISVQAKGRQAIQVRLTCRAMVFANGAPKSLYDKTAGWERRLIILSAKPVPRGKVNDPNLSDRLAEETEGIFLWAFEGLKRLIAQGFKFTLSDHARRNIEEMKEDNCSIVGFLADKQFVRYGSELECSTADLYYGYCQWCRLNSVTFIRRESFNTWMKQNADKYGLVYERYVASVGSSKKARGYRGITCLYHACAD
ncbi:MAG: phage/plasmid primase, P4 family [Oscillospiraceae bacterium]